MNFASCALITTQTIAGKHIHQVARLVAILLFAFGLAKADQLDTKSYNFQLIGGGGGASAVLDLHNQIEIFCNDFNNDIYVPHSNYSADLTTFTQAGLDAGDTRFGEMASNAFKSVTIDDSDSNDATEQSTINGATALGRYQMAGYLVSQYNVADGSNAANNNIQMAIWELLDPASYKTNPMSLNPSAQPTEALEMAADWYQATNETAREAYLQNYRIVSDATMTCPTGGCVSNSLLPMVGGFQEQISAVPEPGSLSLLAIGAIGIALGARRRRAA